VLITLEHNGTQEAILASNELKDMIEEEFSFDTEPAISANNSTIRGYSNGKHIFTSDVPMSKSNLATIKFILTYGDVK